MLKVKFLIQTCVREEIIYLHDLLEQQGIEFNSAGKIDLNQFQWQPGFEKELGVGE